MKTILLIITIILLFYRIKGTPRMLSKSIYQLQMQKLINKRKPMEKEYEEVIKGVTIIFVLLLELFIFIYYIMIGCKVGTNIIIILSALECITVFISLKISMEEFDTILSINVEDFKFHRGYWLLNVILDYIYYPLVIYMLLK